MEPLIARASLDWGFEIRIDNPDEVGADRLLNALSGHRRFGGPMMKRAAKRQLGEALVRLEEIHGTVN